MICEISTSHNRLQESVVNTQLRKVCANSARLGIVNRPILLSPEEV